MKKLLLLLSVAAILTCCSKNNNREKTPEPDNRPELFGYRFGATIKEVNPEKIITLDSCLTFSYDVMIPSKIFIFNNNKLTSICDLHSTNSLLIPDNSVIIRNIEKSSPPVDIELTKLVLSPIREYWTLPKSLDNLTWQYNGFNIKIYNHIVSDERVIIINYTPSDI